MSAWIVSWSMMFPDLIDSDIRSSSVTEIDEFDAAVAFSTHDASDAKADADVTRFALGEFGML
jgi:hypothetical protein